MLEKFFQLGNRVRIYPTKEDSEIYFLSQIEDIRDEEVVISAPIKLGRVLPLAIGREYTFDFYTNHAIYRTKAMVNKRSHEEKFLLLHLKVDEKNLKKIQRRNYFRVNCSVPMKVLEYISDNDDEELINDLPHEAIVVNISGGGFKFVSKNLYQPKSTVKAELDLELKEESVTVEIEGKILDSEPLYDKNKRYLSRLEFTDILPIQQQQIVKYVFDQQVRQKGNKER